MATVESFDELITRCPLVDDAVTCPTLVRDLELARESSGEVMIHQEQHESDNSTVRVMQLMQGAVQHMRKYPCEGCPGVELA